MIPQDISVDLESLLMRMLDKDPKSRSTMKDLLANEWITQEITNNFDFASIVPCDDIEAHPDIYYTPGQVFSNATALSTSHDSLSLVDDESIGDDIDDDFNEDFSAAHSISTRSKTGNNLPTLNCTFDDETHRWSPQFESNRKMLIANCSDISSLTPANLIPPNISLVNIDLPLSINTLTTSKSENNIFERNSLALPYGPANFDVVSSLSDLSDDASCFYDRRQMNDLSKTTVLNRFSDDDETNVGKTNRF